MVASQNKMGADQEPETNGFNRYAGCDKRSAQRRRAQKGEGGEDQEPTRYQHQQTCKLHG